jgi:hypothetical protein
LTFVVTLSPINPKNFTHKKTFSKKIPEACKFLAPDYDIYGEMSLTSTKNPAVGKPGAWSPVPITIKSTHAPLIAQVVPANPTVLKAIAAKLSNDPNSFIFDRTFSVTLPSGEEKSVTGQGLCLLLLNEVGLSLPEAVAVLYGLSQERPTPDEKNLIPLPNPKQYADRWAEPSHQTAVSIANSKHKNPLDILTKRKALPPDSPDPYCQVGYGAAPTITPATAPSHPRGIKADGWDVLTELGPELSILNKETIAEAKRERDILRGDLWFESLPEGLPEEATAAVASA